MQLRDIPTYTNDQKQIFFWEFDEFLMLAFAFGCGLMTGYLGTMLLGWFAVNKYYRRLKDRRLPGFLQHLAYWHLGIGAQEGMAVTTRPNPFIRRFF